VMRLDPKPYYSCHNLKAYNYWRMSKKVANNVLLDDVKTTQGLCYLSLFILYIKFIIFLIPVKYIRKNLCTAAILSIVLFLMFFFFENYAFGSRWKTGLLSGSIVSIRIWALAKVNQFVFFLCEQTMS
jgi:hypothetical protein